jgi:hypothetical protein
VVSIEEYVQIDKRIDTAEDRSVDAIRESLRERWEFGKLMLAERKGKQLPKGRIGELVEATGKSQAELSWRAQFAEQYPTEAEVYRALETFTSWSQVKRSLSKPAKPQGKSPSPKPQDRAVEREHIEQEAKDEAVTIDWASLPGTAAKKAETMRRQIRRELEAEFWRRVSAAVQSQIGAADREIRAMHNRIECFEFAQRNGALTHEQYNLIRSCLHPDSRASASEAKLTRAFRVFTEANIKLEVPPRAGVPPLPDRLVRVPRTPRR